MKTTLNSIMKRVKMAPFDKKNSVTFHLVHRSQRDPLQADDDAPQHILLPILNARRKEQNKYGIYHEDGYDYMQHLKEVDELDQVEMEMDPMTIRSKKSGRRTKGKVDDEEDSAEEEEEEDVTITKISRDDPSLVLPSSVFASKEETKIGMLNKAAPNRDPKFDWDPDIVAALDDDFDYEDPDNELEDNFMELANPNFSEDCENNEDAGSEEYEGSDVDSDFGPMEDDDFDPFAELETKTRFTNYSMSSSVIRRNKGLSDLDDQFEKFYETYDEGAVGALDNEDIDGAFDKSHMVLAQIINKREDEKKLRKMKMKDFVVPPKVILVSGSESDSSDEEEEMVVVEEKPKEQWDCESIISTYSNLYNHPKVIGAPEKKIDPIKITNRAEIPADVLPTRGLTKRQIEQMNYDATKEERFVNTYRPRGESAEEKKMRKQQVKEQRKMRRIEKKGNKAVFKDEKTKQEKELYNMQQNMKGVKIV